MLLVDPSPGPLGCKRGCMTFEEFLAIELAPLSGYARALTGDRDLAHDILTEALIRAQLRWVRISGMERPGAYVRSIVTNGFFSYQRRWSSRFVKVTSSGRLPDQPTAGGGGPVEDRDQLDQLLRLLPRQQRAAIVLRYYLDLSDPDIAAELRCTQSAVRAYISRGLATVRALRERQDDDAPTPGRRPENGAPSNLNVIGEH